jgi:hypothetical protein
MSYFDQTAALFRFLRQNRKVRGAAVQGCSKRLGRCPNNIPAERRIRINIRSAEFDMPLDWRAER